MINMSYYFKNIPNILTISRIIIAPIFFLFFIYNNYLVAFILFVIANATDALDGFFARRYNMVSNFGSIYDPLADKILILFAFMCIYFKPPFVFTEPPLDMYVLEFLYLPLCLIIFRDIIISFLRQYLKKNNIILKAAIIGKIKTWLQFLFVSIYLIELLLLNSNLSRYNFNYGILELDIAISLLFGLSFLLILYITSLISIISGFFYIFKNRSHIS